VTFATNDQSAPERKSHGNAHFPIDLAYLSFSPRTLVHTSFFPINSKNEHFGMWREYLTVVIWHQEIFWDNITGLSKNDLQHCLFHNGPPYRVTHHIIGRLRDPLVRAPSSPRVIHASAIFLACGHRRTLSSSSTFSSAPPTAPPPPTLLTACG
jgi:hypothetical protein